MKVEIPKEVADAIESLRMDDASNHNIISNVLGSANSQRVMVLRNFAGGIHGGFNTLLKALVNGYTVKQEPITVTITPEQQKRVKNFYLNYQYVHGDTVLKILKFLGITIEGVND